MASWGQMVVMSTYVTAVALVKIYLSLAIFGSLAFSALPVTSLPTASGFAKKMK